MLRHPRLLILDEATSALDSITAEQITDTIPKVSALQMQITILIAHRLSTIMHADTIHVLEGALSKAVVTTACSSARGCTRQSGAADR